MDLLIIDTNIILTGLMYKDPDDNHIWDILIKNKEAILLTYDRRLLGNPPVGRAVMGPGRYFRILQNQEC